MIASVVRAVQRANRPGPPEHSVALRVAAAGSVTVGILACTLQGELAPWFAAVAVAVVVAGNAFSYRRRATPLPFLKLVLAAAMLGAFAWFFATVSAVASTGDLASVEGPLAALFTAMQAAHAFDVPSRRDLAFSLAGSATLVAVAAAQAVSLRFGALVVAWAVLVVVGLAAMWGSMSGGGRPRPAGIALSIAAAVVVAVTAVSLAPAPRPAGGLVAPSVYGAGAAGAQPSRLVPGTPGSTPRPASASGPTGVGGFLGFAGPLDTAVRGTLGNEVVLRVRADRPSYWIAETFDRWSGQSWTETAPAGRPGRWQVVRAGPPFLVPPAGPLGPPSATPAAATAAAGGGPAGAAGGGSADYQTFYLATEGTDLVLHASQAAAVWYPTSRLYVSPDGTIRSATTLGPGSIYTVLSTVTQPTPAQLGAVSGTTGLTGATRAADLQLPHPYHRVAALARRIVAGRTSTYAKVQALEHWMGAHTRYTTDIPPLGPGQDTVTQFLFGSRRGYCEQISTALAVMLRTLGIPAREATGYVPGPYDPITDLYQVQAKDAHAWVQVWFPGLGWQSFDPTASVPLANPSPAAAIGHELAGALRHVPLLPTGLLLAAAVAVAALVRHRRRRPAHWRAAVTANLEAAARHLGLAPGAGTTLGVLAVHLDRRLAATRRRGAIRRGAGTARLTATAFDVALAAEVAAWGGRDLDPAEARDLVRASTRLRRAAWRRRLGTLGRRPAPPLGTWPPAAVQPVQGDRDRGLVVAGRPRGEPDRPR